LSAVNNAKKRPNLLFVFADQMRGQAIGCMGNEQVHTPNLDQLASEGVLLTNAISTLPICCPARASLLTGRYPLSHGVYTNGPELPDSEVTVGEILKAEGYQTAYIGKWHLLGHGGKPGQPYGSSQYIPPGPKRHGFDYWAASNIIHDYFNSYYFTDTDEKVPIDGWEPDTQTDLAVNYLGEYDGEQPFCLFLSWAPPHDPYVAPDKYLEMYPPENIKLRDNVFLADKSVIAAYYAAITSLDWNMGRLIEVLDRQGLADNTIVVFTSDHGAQLFSLYLFHKQWPYEETILVPFIIRYPQALEGGGISDVLMGTPDILPTLLGLMDVEIPDVVEGKDLSPFLLGTAAEPEPDSVLIEVIRPTGVVPDRTGMRAWRGVRTKRYTYVRFRTEDWLLIDNKYDPFQRRNLIHNPDYRDLRNELHQKLEEWLRKTNDSFPPADEYPHFEMSRNQPPLKPEKGERA
jgi:arylsulfatase A-like enzyme